MTITIWIPGAVPETPEQTRRREAWMALRRWRREPAPKVRVLSVGRKVRRWWLEMSCGHDTWRARPPGEYVRCDECKRSLVCSGIAFLRRLDA